MCDIVFKMETKKCSVEGCDNKKYQAKGLCHNHYQLNQRNGKPQYKAHSPQKCKVETCDNLATPFRDLCHFHQVRKLNGVPLDIPKGKAFMGERNPNWKGGIAEYPNHSLMKQIRKEILKEANNVCHFCGKYANQIHHKDLSKDNHAKENLVASCHKCNHLPEHKKIYTSKYRKHYGLALFELRKIGFSCDPLKERLRIGL